MPETLCDAERLGRYLVSPGLLPPVAVLRVDLRDSSQEPGIGPLLDDKLSLDEEPMRSFDGWHQPFRQFALHYVFIYQPQDSLRHLGIR